MTIHFEPASWVRAGHGYESVAPEVDGHLSSIIAGTTDPAACGAASGLATVDDAISILLGILSGVMTGVQSDVTSGLLAESSAMIGTGNDYAALEDSNAEIANDIVTGW